MEETRCQFDRWVSWLISKAYLITGRPETTQMNILFPLLRKFFKKIFLTKILYIFKDFQRKMNFK